MGSVLGEFEEEYADILTDWDGIIERFDGAEEILKKLIPKGEKPPKLYTPIEELQITEHVAFRDMEDKEVEEEGYEEEDEVEEDETEPPEDEPRLPPPSPSLD
jgi:hypothetical protein